MLQVATCNLYDQRMKATHPWRTRPGRVNVRCAGGCGRSVSRPICRVTSQEYCRVCKPRRPASGPTKIDATAEVADPGLEQVLEARRLLGWTQKEHARQAGMSTRSLRDYETRRAVPRPPWMRAIVGVLQRAGVRFTPQGPVLKRETIR